MILKEVLEKTSCTNVSIMDGIFPMITIFYTGDYAYLLDHHTLNSEIQKMDVYDDRIRVWLENKED